MSTMKPRSPLPWISCLGDVIGADKIPVVLEIGSTKNADYITHACNAYPKLIKLLHAIDAGMRPETAALAARNTLLDLGELPPE